MHCVHVVGQTLASRLSATHGTLPPARLPTTGFVNTALTSFVHPLANNSLTSPCALCNLNASSFLYRSKKWNIDGSS